MFCRKIAIIFFIALSYTQTYPQIGSDETLDIVTWNIQNFPKNGNVTIDAISQIIQDLNVDIIALQEIEGNIAFNNILEYPIVPLIIPTKKKV